MVRERPFQESEIKEAEELGGTQIDISDDDKGKLGLDTDVVAYRIPLTASPFNLINLFTPDGQPVVRVDGEYISSNGTHRGLLVTETSMSPISHTDKLADYLRDPSRFPPPYQRFLDDLQNIDPNETAAVVLNIGSNVSSASSTDARQQQNPYWWKRLIGNLPKTLKVHHLDRFTADSIFAFSPTVQYQLKEHWTGSTKDRSIEITDVWRDDDISGTTIHRFHPIYLPAVLWLPPLFKKARDSFYQSLTDIIEQLIARKIPVIIQNNAIFKATTFRTETNRDWEMFPQMKAMVDYLNRTYPITNQSYFGDLSSFLQVRVHNVVGSDGRAGTISEFRNKNRWELFANNMPVFDVEDPQSDPHRIHKWMIVTKDEM